MSTADLLVKINSMPEHLRKKVLAYIEALIAGQPKPKETPKKRMAGLSKGKIWIADDFDAPLDDFKEYME
ncbi:MAG: DUF2281 domain-containing protein [Flavobacteriales bacterium]|nr:DUF2281 domain-containing protein [Flavobacteriales bacterium]MEB2342481.1 DUF2281 domain-containing protein [Flavobacteriia bacterium]